MFFLLVNTYKYWSYSLGVTGFVYLLIFALFIVLTVVSIVQLIKLFREKFQDYNRRVATAALLTVLFLAFKWPEGILPGTAPTDKFENLALENTGLDLYAYSSTVVKDSMTDDNDIFGDYYYIIVVEYSEQEFEEIVKHIEQTKHYDVVPMFRSNEYDKWDSLNIGTLPGLWDDSDDSIWFVANPNIETENPSEHFNMWVDKSTRRISIQIVNT